MIDDPCPACKGEGRVQGENTIKVTVPAGVSQDNYIPLQGQGNAGRRGGPDGDLLVVIGEKEHPNFTRNGDDILYDLFVSFPTAVLGGEVEVPTLTGRARLTVEPGTPGGRMLRMRERGIPHLNGYGKGDQLVRINVWVPTKLTAKEKEALNELSTLEHITPTEEDRKTSKSFFSKVRDAFS